MKRLIIFLAALLCAAAHATTLNPIQLLNPAGSTSGQAIVSTGASTAPAWGNVAATALAAQAANTVVANVTASSASPTAFAMPSCGAAGNNLQWTSGTGFTCATGYAQLASPTFTGTVTTAALTATGAITPSQTAGIVGTTTNNNANAGSVGEYLTGTGSGVSLTTGTPANCASVSLTAGDWDVWGVITFTPAGSTSMSGYNIGISDVSATIQSNKSTSLNLTLTTGLGQAPLTPVVRESLSATTTVYAVAALNFAASTATCAGFIAARRVR